MRALLVLALLLSPCTACVNEYAPWDVKPAAVLTPEAPPAQLDAWRAVVAYDAKRWNDGLALIGCPAPFVMGDDGHMIKLVPRAAWGYDDLNAWTSADHIEVRAMADGDAPTDGAVLHELGHAIGLGHADPKWGPSAMLPESPSYFYRRDIDAAGCRLGCAPCDPSADPYDGPI